MRVLAAVVFAAASLLCGCAAPVVIASAGANALQAGTSAFINGELDSAQIAPLDTVYHAALASLDALKFPVYSSRLTKRGGGITSSEVNGRGIRIEFAAKSPVVTKINIRVGLLGDQAISRLILGEIQARCPAIPGPEPILEPETVEPAPPPRSVSPGPP